MTVEGAAAMLGVRDRGKIVNGRVKDTVEGFDEATAQARTATTECAQLEGKLYTAQRVAGEMVVDSQCRHARPRKPQRRLVRSSARTI